MSKKKFTILLKIAFLLGAIFFISEQISLPKLETDLGELDYYMMALAIIANILSTAFSAERTRLYLDNYGLKISRIFANKLYFMGSFFNTVLPGGIGGDGYKIYLLWKVKKFNRIRALRIALYERTNGFYVLALFGFLLFLTTDYINLDPLLLILDLILIIAITPIYFLGVKSVLKDKPATAFAATKISIFVQVLQLVSAYFALHALIKDPSLEVTNQFMFLFVVASIIAIIPISIGGAGLRELTFLYGIKLLPSTSIELGVAFGMLIFIANFASSVIGGIIFAFSKIRK